LQSIFSDAWVRIDNAARINFNDACVQFVIVSGSDAAVKIIETLPSDRWILEGNKSNIREGDDQV